MISFKIYELQSPDGKILLKNISFEILPGNRLAFYGPNGCGKSTLLRYIAGLEPQDQAEQVGVQFDNVAYLPTRPLDLLLPWLTVTDNIHLFSKLAKQNSPKRHSNLTLNYRGFIGYDLKTLGNAEVYKLSSGQQAILAIYCALLQEADLLVADEIFATLSEALRQKLADYLREQGITIICASHDSNFLKQLNAKIVDLEQHITVPV